MKFLWNVLLVWALCASPNLISSKSYASSADISDKRLAVTEYLIGHGVSPEEAESRVSFLNDAEIQELNLDLEQERAGQSSTVTLGVGTAILIGLILFIL